MNLDLLFKREEAASGLLAAALAELPGARRAFFSLLDAAVDAATMKALKAATWRVEAEVDGFDLRLTSTNPSWVIVVENKIQSASVRPGQLQRYYDSLFQGHDAPHRQVGLVLLAPGEEIGRKELGAVKPVPRSPGRRDFVARVSWNRLADSLCASDLEGVAPMPHWLLATGMDAVRSSIERLELKRDHRAFPNKGGRKRFHEVAQQVAAGLNARLRVGGIDQPWPKRDRFILSTRHTRMTLWLCLEFQTQEQPPFDALDARGPSLDLVLHAMMKPAAKFAGHPEVKTGWNDLADSGSFEVQGVGKLQRKPDGWYHVKVSLHGDEKELTSRCTDLGARLLRVVERFGSAKQDAPSAS